MKLSLIAPRSMAAQTAIGDMQFIIPPSACRYYRVSKIYKILDNGTYELGRPLPCDELLEVAKFVKANEIVLPDVLFNERKTFEMTREFIQTVRKQFQYAVVPQAKDPRKWVDSYIAMSKLDDVDVMCLPKWLDSKFHCRAAMISYLVKKRLLVNKPHHLLGLDNVADLLNIKHHLIRSVDTSKPFSYAYRGKMLQLFKEVQGIHRVKFDQPELAKEYYPILFYNIRIIREAAHWNEL